MRGLKISNLTNLSLLLTVFTKSVWIVKMHGQQEKVICNQWLKIKLSRVVYLWLLFFLLINLSLRMPKGNT